MAALLALFQKFIQELPGTTERWESLSDLIEERADISIRRALDGFNMSYEDALRLIKQTTDLTAEQQEQRDIIIAAINNLIDFSVVAEYQMSEEIDEMIEELSEEELAEMDEDDLYDYLLPAFSRYNDRYMRVENLDIEYAMIVAAYFASLKSDTMLMYMTMGDERVRPWHLQWEGFTAPKSSFPDWLIPPIEHQCRCFLVEDSNSVMGSVQASATPQIPEWFNPTFKESVAKGGRIFSDSHPYFQIQENHIKLLKSISNGIRDKYFG